MSDRPPAENGEFKSDKPIKSYSEDAFNRSDYAKRVAETIWNRHDADSLIIGIHAPWGDGKTSVMSMIKEDLDAKTGIATVWFNPWNFSNPSDLIKGLFDVIALSLKKKLTTKSEDAFQAATKYGKVAGAIGGLFGQSELINNLTSSLENFSSVDLDTQKDRLINILREEKVRVVIFVDDIDRLDKNEVHSIFKLVKLTGDFDYMTYILAFDDKIVAQSLNERYGDFQDSGQKFLEKIIQVPLRLPPIRPELLRAFTFSRIDEVIKDTGLVLSEKEIRDFVENYIKGIESRVSSPRMAKLYSNSVRFSHPLISGELNNVDYLLFEGIKILYPLLYSAICNDRELFINPFKSDMNMSYEYADLVKSKIDKILLTLSPEDKKSAENLLLYLFPKLSGVYRRTFIGSDFEKYWTADKRLCSSDYFDKYIYYTVSSSEMSDKEMSYLLGFTRFGDADQVNKEIAKIVDSPRAHSLIKKLRQIEDTAAVETLKMIALYLSKNSGSLNNGTGFMSFAGNRSQSAVFSSRVVERIKDHTDKLKFSRDIVENSQSPAFSLEFLHWLEVSKDKDSNNPIIALSEREKLEELVLKDIIDKISRDSIFDLYRDDISYLSHYARKHGQKIIFTDNLTKSIQDNRGLIIELIRQFSGTSYNVSSGGGGRKSFGKEGYENLTDLVDGEWIDDQIVMFMGEKISGKTEYDRDLEEDELLAIQFRRHHQNFKLDSDQSSPTPATP